MTKKSLVLLGLAILCGLAAMYGTNRLLMQKPPKAPGDTVDVLVAARRLKVEEVLTPELVKVVPMSRAITPPRHLHGVQGRRGPPGQGGDQSG